MLVVFKIVTTKLHTCNTTKSSFHCFCSLSRTELLLWCRRNRNIYVLWVSIWVKITCLVCYMGGREDMDEAKREW
jgi:hypothetical protein